MFFFNSFFFFEENGRGLSPYCELNNFKKGKKVQALQKSLESAEKEGPMEL